MYFLSMLRRWVSDSRIACVLNHCERPSGRREAQDAEDRQTSSVWPGVSSGERCDRIGWDFWSQYHIPYLQGTFLCFCSSVNTSPMKPVFTREHLVFVVTFGNESNSCIRASVTVMVSALRRSSGKGSDFFTSWPVAWDCHRETSPSGQAGRATYFSKLSFCQVSSWGTRLCFEPALQITELYSFICFDSESDYMWVVTHGGLRKRKGFLPSGKAIHSVFKKLPENPIVYKFFHCVLFICQEKSCTIPTCVSKTNGSFHNTARRLCIFTWVVQLCFGRKDLATFAHVLFSLVCKLWPPLKLAPNEPTGFGLVVGILLNPQLDRVLLGSLKRIGCFQGAWASLNIWINCEWTNGRGWYSVGPSFLGRPGAHWWLLVII